MPRITEHLIRQRAEHNEGMVSTLEEVALHQQNLDRIELLGHLCPKLKILYLQNNLIGKIQNLHKLKALQYLNLAMNNITKIQNLQRCESLEKLDLTVNFVDKAGLLSVASLTANPALRDLFMLGNPCTDWPGYRAYVIAQLPQLHKLDGLDVKHSEQIAAQQLLPELHQQLRDEVAAGGLDPDRAEAVEDDADWEGEVEETGTMGEDGQMRRPWCAATRILEHREMEQANREAEAKKAAGKAGSSLDNEGAFGRAAAKHNRLPQLAEGEVPLQRNEGRWEFSLDESEDGRSVVLDVAVGKFLDTSLIEADVQPLFVRLLIKGRLLQLRLPMEVLPDRSQARRSSASGRLVLTMPKMDPRDRDADIACVRRRKETSDSSSPATRPDAQSTLDRAPAKPRPVSVFNIVKDHDVHIREVQKARVQAVDEEDDDFIPALS